MELIDGGDAIAGDRANGRAQSESRQLPIGQIDKIVTLVFRIVVGESNARARRIEHIAALIAEDAGGNGEFGVSDAVDVNRRRSAEGVDVLVERMDVRCVGDKSNQEAGRV